MALAAKLLDNILQFGTADSVGIFSAYTGADNAYISSSAAGTVQVTGRTINVGLGTDSTSNAVYMYGDFYIRSAGTTNVFTVDNSNGNTSISGTLGLSGKATFSNDLQVNGNTVLGDAVTDFTSIYGPVTFKGGSSSTSLISDGSTTLNLFDSNITTANVLGAADIIAGKVGGAHTVRGLATTFINGSTGNTSVIVKAAAASPTATFDIKDSSNASIASIGKTTSSVDAYLAAGTGSNLYLTSNSNTGLYVGTDGKVGIHGTNTGTYQTLITGTMATTGSTSLGTAGTATLTFGAPGSSSPSTFYGPLDVAGTLTVITDTTAVSLFDDATTSISIGNAVTNLNLGKATASITSRGNFIVAANQNFTMPSGTGVFAQTHSSVANTASFAISNTGVKTGAAVGASITNTATSTSGGIKKALALSSTGSWTGTSAENQALDISTSGAAINKGISITSSGSHTSNYGIYVSASGATNNYAAWFESGNVHIKNGVLETGATTSNIFNATATTVNIAGAATTLNLGADGEISVATIRNRVVTLPNASTFNIDGASPTLASTSTGTLTLFNTNIATVNAFGAATTILLGNNTNASYVSIKGTKPATAVDSASLVVAGGLGVAGKAIIGGAEDLAGDLTFTGSGTASIASNKATVSLFDTNAVTSLSLAGGTGATSISIGTGTTGSAQSVVIGNTVASGTTTIQSPTTNFTGLIQANNGIALAANKSLALASGTGQITQTFTGTTTAAQSLIANSLSNEGTGVSVSSTSTGAGNIYLIKAVKTGSSAGASYGVYSSVSGAGTSVGGYFSASGGTNNYAIQIPAGSLRINDVDIYSPSSTNLSVTGNMTVSGNLTINGTTTVINTQQLAVSDNLITLNSDYTSGAPSENAGVEVRRGGSLNASLLWNETDDRWTIDKEGAAGTMQPIATRVSAPLSTGVLYWDDSAKTLSTSAGFTYASNTLTAPNVVGSTSISSPIATIGTNLTITGSSLSWVVDGSLITPASTSASTKAISIVTGNATAGPNLSAGTILFRSGSYTGTGTSNIEFWTGGKTGANDYAIQIDRANNIKLGAAGADTSITHVSGTTTAYNLSLEASSTGLTSTANGGNLILKSGKGYGATGTSDILLQTGSGSAGHTQVTRVKINATGLGLLSTATADKYLFIKNTNTHSGAVDRALSINVNEADRTLSLSGNVTVGGTFSTTGTFSSGGNFSTSSTVSITGAMTLTGPFSTSGAGGITITNGMGSSTTSMTLPALASDTLVSRTSTDTLTNKTLTSPKINEDVALTTTATSLNILNGLTAKTGTGTTVVYNTSPAISTSITSVGADFSLADNATGATTAFAAASSVTIGGSYTTGGSYGFATGATASGTKTVNIGTGGTAGTTAINLGSSAGAGNITSNQDFVIASGKNLTVISGTTSLTSPVTTLNGVTITANSLTTGNALYISSSSTTSSSSPALISLSRTGAQTGAATLYGIKVSVTSTGASAANIGGYFSAEGAAISNNDIVLEHGTIKSNVTGANAAFTFRIPTENTGNLFELYNGTSKKFAIGPDGAVISDVAISGGSASFSGDLAVNGTPVADITTTTNSATVFNTTALTVSAFGAATALNLGTSVATGTTQTITIGSTNTAGQVTFGSSKDYTSASDAGLVINGGAYIAKQLVVNTNLTVNGSTTLGDAASADIAYVKSKLYLYDNTDGSHYTNIIVPNLSANTTITLPTTTGKTFALTGNASGVVDVASGGTNLSSYASGDIIYASGTTTLARLAAPSSLSALTNSSSGPGYTSVTSTNTSSAIVQRDASGNFTAGVITAGGLSVTNSGDSASFGGNVTITGNLTVNGTTVTLSTDNLEVEDVQVTLNSGAAVAANSGLIVNRGTGNTASKLLWNESGSPAQVWQIDKEGAAGTMQAIATRADSNSMTSGGLAYWNATEKRFDTDSGITRSGSGAITATATVGFVGNASTANAWKTGRTITLTGTANSAAAGVTATSASWTGSNNLSITTQLQSHAYAGTAFGVADAAGVYGHVTITASQGITVTSGALALNWTTSGGSDTNGSYGTAVTVARGDHTHKSAGITDATDVNTASMIVERSSSGEFSIYKTRYGLPGQADKADIRWNDTASALEFVLY